ncbi:hypothetical protein QJQ45_007979 [Haematococcus lacustris]|nr:hypothetical protein QJQ45_007979 [Haematococcus lacustris]
MPKAAKEPKEVKEPKEAKPKKEKAPKEPKAKKPPAEKKAPVEKKAKKEKATHHVDFSSYLGTDACAVFSAWRWLQCMEAASVQPQPSAIPSLSLYVVLHITQKKKDPNAPKKPLSSYMIWCQENRERIKTDNPDMKLTEISSEMGRQWKEVDEDTKKEYHAKAETEKGKYKKAMEGYKSKAESEEEGEDGGEEDEDDDEDE